MTEADKKEAAILADAINVIMAGVEISGLGKIVTKIDENNLADDPRNIIVNQAALGTFSVILKEKVRSMYQAAKVSL